MSLLVPMTAYPLGIGDIKLHSALNQKLNAEIALSLASGEELKDIKITLASPDQFDKAGIAWSSFLSKIKFKPVLQSNGKVVVQISSNTIVQEPYLDFLLEVSWPKGNVLKEFTVLVDPPAIYQKNTITTPSSGSVKKPTSDINDSPITTNNDFNRLAVVGEYGPITRYDSLWKVAEKINKESTVSVEQMMMALYKANPHAFYKKNVNALMAGKTLKIPKQSEIFALSKKQANTQFYRQMAVWEGKAIAEPEVRVADNKRNTTNQLTLVAPVEEKLNQSEVLATNGENTQQLSTENIQLQERLANLEKQFVLMQEMLAIKDQQLAALQNAQNIPKNQVISSEATAKEAAKETAVVSKEVATNSSADSSAESSKITAEQNSITVTTPPSTVKKAPKVVVSPKPVEPVELSSGTNYYYLGLGIFGLLALSGVGFILWRRRQSEIEETDINSMFASSSEIILPKDDVDDEFELSVFDETPSYDVGTVGESSFLSEFTPSDFDVLETDQAEVDPTSEADVYLAYGRYQQAEELMRYAIEESPDRDDFKLKLLEIFYASENGEAFEVFAKELSEQGKRADHEFWAKVSEMGSEIIPESSLFSAESHESIFEVPDVSDNEIVLAGAVENEVNTTEAIKEPVVNEVKNEVDNSDIDFDLSSFSLLDSNEEGQEAKDAVQNDDIESVDFDLSSFSDVVEDKMPATENSNDELETFDFDMDNSVDQQTPTEISMDDMEEPVGTLELNDDESNPISLDDFDFNSSIGTSVEVNDSKGEAKILANSKNEVVVESNDFDFDFDFDDAPMASESESLVSEDGLMVSDLTDMDEFETKIDLAKAYIDMGDEDSAKDIAQEVLEKGSDAQKTEAQAIIDNLA